MKLCRIALCAIALLKIVSAVHAAAPTDQSPTSITLSEGRNTVDASYHFGKIYLPPNAQIQHQFQLINNGSRPITITDLEPSCHCTTAIVVGVKSDTMPTIAPGGHVNIEVTVTLNPLLSGPVAKDVAVYAGDEDNPVADIQINGILKPVITYNPPIVNFNSVSYNSSKSVLLKVSVANALVSLANKSKLISDSSVLKVLEIQQSRSLSNKTHTYIYKVTFERNAPLGHFHTLLHFTSISNANDQVSLADGPSVVAEGDIVGAATASPSSLSFGVVTQGEGAAKKILVTENTQGAHTKILASTRSRSLTLNWRVNSLKQQFLQVSVNSDAMPGPLQTTITIDIEKGQRLIIPVSGYIKNAVH